MNTYWLLEICDGCGLHKRNLRCENLLLFVGLQENQRNVSYLTS
jgi:hypothetical protein